MTKIYILDDLTAQQKRDKNICIYIINTVYADLINNPGDNTLFNVCTTYGVNIYNAIQNFNEIINNVLPKIILTYNYEDKINHIRTKLHYLKQTKDELEYVKATWFIK